jgi:hypothetical protein
MSLVGGVVAMNALFLALGYALLARPLGALDWRTRASWAGVALLLGAGALGTGVFFAAILGAHASVVTALVTAAVLAGLGIFVRIGLPQAPGTTGPTTAALFAVVAAAAALGIVGGFRSAPWLDDAWGIWLPKGLTLWHHGLDERLFAPNGRYVAFGVPDYPLWWSTVSSLDVQAVGELDVRVMPAQLALLTVAFLGAVTRLLWGVVRGWLLAASLALIALSPELWRHVQGGAADLPLAIYIALFGLGLAGWVATQRGLWLLLAIVGGVTALQIKPEAIAEALIVALVAVAAAAAGGSRRALRGVAAATAAVAASALPWLLWRAAHDVPARSPLGDALDPGYLGDRAERVSPALEELGAQILTPLNWLLIVPLLVGVLVLGFLRERRGEWLLPLAGLALGFVFLVWAYWSNPDDIDFLVATSAYRTVDPLVLTAAVFLPVAAERLIRTR